MPAGCRFEQLKAEILARSQAKAWDRAVEEWNLDHVEVLCVSEEAGTCLCGHRPIRHLCHLRNEKSRQTAVVGNVCVEHFVEGGEAGGVFEEAAGVVTGVRKYLGAVRRAQDALFSGSALQREEMPEAFIKLKAEESLVAFAEKRGVFAKSREWDDGAFYRDVKGKKLDSLTERQQQKRYEMNMKLCYSIIYSAGTAFAELAKTPLQGTAGPRLVEAALAAGVLAEADAKFYRESYHRWYYDPKFSEKQRRYRASCNQRILASPALQLRFPCLRAGAAATLQKLTGADARLNGERAEVVQYTGTKWEVRLPAGSTKQVGEAQLKLLPQSAAPTPATPPKRPAAGDLGSEAKQAKTAGACTYLACPYDQKDEAKGMGARFDDAKKQWYVPAGVDVAPFLKWLPAPARRDLDCPYAEKDEAKALAPYIQYDFHGNKKWFVPAGKPVLPLAKWLPGLKDLVAMGFARADAERALAQADSVEAAAALLA